MRNFKPFTELFDILETMRAFNDWTDLTVQLNLLVNDKRGAYILFKNLMVNSEPSSDDNSRCTAVEKLLHSRIVKILEYWETGASAPADTFSALWHRAEITDWAIASSDDLNPILAANKLEFKGLDICLEVK